MRTIETFLQGNSDLIPDRISSSHTAVVKAGSELRPDKVFGATASMKWAMILNGIDSPYMLAKAKAYVVPDESSLNSETVELVHLDF